MASGRVTGTTSNGRYIYVDWTSTPNASNNTSSFTAIMYLFGNTQGNAVSGSYFYAGGTTNNFTHYVDNWETVTPDAIEVSRISNLTISHNSSGTASVEIKGSFIYNGSWTRSDISSTWVTLDTIPQTPGAPTNVSVSGTYAKDQSTVMTWTKGTGTVTGYEVHRRTYNKKTNTWGAYELRHSNYPVSTTYTVLHDYGALADGYQLRIRALNGSNYSSWVEAPAQYRLGLSFYNGSSWSRPNEIKVWNGSTWTKGYTYVWNGSAWVEGQ